MDMTNKMIILMESVKLMEDGVISGSGIKGKTPDGKIVELPEVLHTYAVWKQLGYQVQKGEKAVAQFAIWKYMKKGKKQQSEEEIDGEESKEKGYCRLVNASFFKASQVKKIEQEVAKC